LKSPKKGRLEKMRGESVILIELPKTEAQDLRDQIDHLQENFPSNQYKAISLILRLGDLLDGVIGSE